MPDKKHPRHPAHSKPFPGGHGVSWTELAGDDLRGQDAPPQGPPPSDPPHNDEPTGP